MRISKKLSLFILGAIVLLLIASRWSGKTDSQSAAASNSMQQGAAKSVLSVQLEAAQQSSMQPRLLANGTVAAWQEAIISAEVQGLVIDKIPVTIGQTVKKGAVLTRFRQQSIANDLAQARAHVAEAKAAWTEADANAERVRHVENSGALSKQQEDQFMNAAILTKAKLDAAEAALRSQQHRFRQTTLRAPDRGIISKNSATIGQVVSAGQLAKCA